MAAIVDRFLAVLARVTRQLAVWYRRPFPVSVAIILGSRGVLRENDLFNTEVAPPAAPPPDDFDVQDFRTADGSYNDLAQPWMGRAGAFFGRNVPLAKTYGEVPPTLYEPNPRLVSSKLLARRELVPIPHLNVFAAAWIQFMVHDWLSHGPNDRADPHLFPILEGDDWPDQTMEVLRTKPDITDLTPAEVIGAADFPAVFEQGPRQGMHLHWDGNNTSLAERNLSAALGAGVTPETVDHAAIERVANWLLTLKPPPSPITPEPAAIDRGHPV
jgi:hypothetical protein